MKSRSVKGMVLSLEILIAITLFSAFFALFIVKLSIASGTSIAQGISVSSMLSSEAQVQHAISIIESPGMTLSLAMQVLKGYFGDRYSLSKFSSANGIQTDDYEIKRIVTIAGDQYYLMVDDNATTNEP